MRLPENRKTCLLEILREAFGGGEFYLFGSRADDAMRGGDVDLARKIDLNPEEFELRRMSTLAELLRRDFPLNLDLVHYTASMDPLVKREIDTKGIPIA